MIKLPKSCEVNKFIPKKVFYEKAQITNNIKKEFVDIIEKIVWMYKLSEDTVNISSTQNVEEIEVFEIILRKDIIPKNVLKLITKLISYPILFIIKYKKDTMYAMKFDDIYYTNWNENIEVSLNFFTLEKVYENIIKSIIKEDNNEKDLKEVIQNKKIQDELQRDIEQLKKKLKIEQQFNRKVEINQKLRKLEKEMEEFNNG